MNETILYMHCPMDMLFSNSFVSFFLLFPYTVHLWTVFLSLCIITGFLIFLRFCAIFIASSTDSAVISFVSTLIWFFLKTGPLRLLNKQSHHHMSIYKLYLYTMRIWRCWIESLFLRYFLICKVLWYLFLSMALYFSYSS